LAAKAKLAFRIVVLAIFAVGSLVISYDFWLLFIPRPTQGFIVTIVPSAEQSFPILTVFLTVFLASLTIGTAIWLRRPYQRKTMMLGEGAVLVGTAYTLIVMLRALLFSVIPSTLDYPILLFMIGVGLALVVPEMMGDE
jgi:hypothetical protein